jgi:hypothetical protein
MGRDMCKILGFHGGDFEECHHLVFIHCVPQLLVAANISSSPILVTSIMEALRSSETWVLTRAAWCNIPEGGILHRNRYSVQNIVYENN